MTPVFSASSTNAAKNTIATFSKVGSYTLQVTISDPGGLTAQSTVTVPVNPMPTSTVMASAVGTYGATATASATLMAHGVAMPNEPITFRLNGSPIGTANTDLSGVATLPGVSLSGIAVGSYGASLIASFAGDSIFLLDASTSTGSLSVTAAPLTVAGITASKNIYDGGTVATLIGTASLVGIVGNDNVTLTGTAIGTFSSANAGTAISVAVAGLSLSGAAAGDYSLAPLTVAADITAAPLTVVVNDKNKVYGASDPALTYTPSGTLYGNDTYSVIGGVSFSTTTGAAATVGTHAITASGGTAVNYVITCIAGALTVSPAPLTVAADNKSMIVGGVFPPFSYTPSSTLYYGDSYSTISGVILSTTPGAASATGTYPITASGGTAANYSISFVPGTLTVLPAPSFTLRGPILATFTAGQTVTIQWTAVNLIWLQPLDLG